MSKIPDREIKLEWVRHQIGLRTLYAQHWIARATTGNAARREVYRFAAKTPENPDGMVRETPEETTDDALNTAETHITAVMWLGEMLTALLNDCLRSYEMAQRALFRSHES